MRKCTHRVLKGVTGSTVHGKMRGESIRETNRPDKNKQTRANTREESKGRPVLLQCPILAFDRMNLENCLHRRRCFFPTGTKLGALF